MSSINKPDSISLCFSIAENKIQGFSEVTKKDDINASNCPFTLLSSSNTSALDTKIQDQAGKNLAWLLFRRMGSKPIENAFVFLGASTITGELISVGSNYDLKLNIENQAKLTITINKAMGDCLCGALTSEPKKVEQQVPPQKSETEDDGWVIVVPPAKLNLNPINNSGTDCFMNAIFQVIMHDKLLKTALIETHTDKKSEKAIAFCKAVKDYSDGKAVSTKDLRKFMPKGSQTGQQDASEFLQSLLQDVPCKNYPDLFAKQKLIYNWEIKNWFGSILETKIIEASEQNYFIPLEILSTNGTKLIQSYFTKKIHRSENHTDASTRKVYTPGTAQVQIEGKPERLVFLLNRFNKSSKITTQIDMPEKIQINNLNYVLKKIVMHSGSGQNNGHYTTLLQEDDSTWTEANDTLISPNQDSSTYRNNGYIYFYELQPSK